MGRLLIHVLNPLVATETVAQTIDFAIEVSGGPDFEFFGPKAPVYFPRPEVVEDEPIVELVAAMRANRISSFQLVDTGATITYKVASIFNIPSVFDNRRRFQLHNRTGL
eukprot:UN33650